MEKLKLCPFCGAAPEMKIEFPADYGGQFANVFVQCQSPLCGAEGAKIPIAKEYVGRVLDSAATLWNLREGVAGAGTPLKIRLKITRPDYKATCSVCGVMSLLKSNFCPHCGAKMDAGAEG